MCCMCVGCVDMNRDIACSSSSDVGGVVWSNNSSMKPVEDGDGRPDVVC